MGILEAVEYFSFKGFIVCFTVWVYVCDLYLFLSHILFVLFFIIIDMYPLYWYLHLAVVEELVSSNYPES
jgi:hypothetical protein